MIYADIGPNTATKGIIMVPLHDDRVEYAQVQHIQTETSNTDSEPEASKSNSCNVIIKLLHLTYLFI
jgi:hypothetical protein